ncbi:MAG TPA: hypothetical protein VJ643_07890 [Nitrososphaera sp.]|nr:hypothetical protein [Nitrososphaera sp.]
MGSKNELILMMLPLVCAIIPAVAALPPAIAQEDTSLGEKENIASSIVSNVLGGSDNANNDGEEKYSAEGEFNQDATVIEAIDPNQERGVDEDNLGEFGDDAAELDDANAAIPITTPTDVQEESSAATSPPADIKQSLSIRFADQPSLTLNQPLDERGLATSASITASGTINVSGSGGTMILTSDTNVFSICEDDETGELSNTQNVQSTVSSDSMTIKPGAQPFEITTDPITEPIGDGGCEEGQDAILNTVQFIEPVLTIQTEGGNTVTHTFPSIP